MRTFLKFVWAPVLVFAWNFTALAQHLYQTTFWFDVFMHILGGFVIGYAAFVAASSWGKSWWSLLPWYAKIAFLIGAACFAGIAWEIYEFVWDRIYGTLLQPDVTDTMKDLIDDLLGGTLLACLSTALTKKSRR